MDVSDDITGSIEHSAVSTILSIANKSKGSDIATVKTSSILNRGIILYLLASGNDINLKHFGSGV